MTGTGDEASYSQLQPMTGESAEPEEPEGIEVDLPDDIYGAAMFSFVFDFYDIFGGGGENADDLHDSMNILRLIFITIVLLFNYTLQMGMLYWIYVYVVAPSVHTVESVYQKYHRDVFDAEGKYDHDKWKKWDEGDKDSLCGIAFASYWFMFAILCLWCYTMLIENRKTERLMKSVKAVEDCTDMKDMIQKSADGVPQIVKLTKPMDWLIFLVIMVPKMIIGMGLLVIGCVWLMATDSFADLILNAVALEFVVAIDNVLFEAALPLTVAEKVAETKFFIKDTSPAQKDAREKYQKDKTVMGYYRSITYFFGVWVFVALMMSYGQYIPYLGVFPNYAHDAECPSYQARISSRICMQGEECFPFSES
jgi:hypothetical protein